MAGQGVGLQTGFRPSIADNAAMPKHIPSETGLDYIAQAAFAVQQKYLVSAGMKLPNKYPAGGILRRDEGIAPYGGAGYEPRRRHT